MRSIFCRTLSFTAESDLSLLPPDTQPQFGKPGPINVFGKFTDTEGSADRAKNRATPTYFRDADGAEYLYFVGNGKDPQDGKTAAAPGLVKMRLTRPANGNPYFRVDVDVAAMDYILQNPGPAVVSSDGGEGAILWVFDENAPRSAIVTGPNSPRPVLYAIDPYTLKILWKSDVGLLQASGKYNSPIVADGIVYVGTDRIVAFGLK